MHYLPTTNEGRLAWAQHLRDNLATYSAAFGNNPQQMADMLNYLSVVIACLQSSIKTYNDYQGAIAAQRLMEENELKLLRGRIADFKRDDGYTEAIGGALGLISSPDVFDAVNYKPVLAVSVEGNLVRIRFKKLGADNVNIYHRLKGSAAWLFLARYTHSPYDDHIVLTNAGVPEHREYIAYGVKNDAEIGQPSDIAQVVFGATA